MKNRPSHTRIRFAGLAVLLFVSGCAEHAFVAYDKTAVFGDTREVVRNGGEYALRFPYRGGVVTYHPSVGSSWAAEPPGDGCSSSVGNGAPALFSTRLPHGCLVFACARAEEIRSGAIPGATKSQAVAFQRTDGSGHAFVIYDLQGKTVAEDDRGYRIDLPPSRNRSKEEALRLSRQFSELTHPQGFPAPASAEFVGEY